jgi:hypothetical protein
MCSLKDGMTYPTSHSSPLRNHKSIFVKYIAILPQRDNFSHRKGLFEALKLTIENKIDIVVKNEMNKHSSKKIITFKNLFI